MRKKSITMMELTKDQTCFHLDAIDNYVDADNAATGALVDPNANQEQKTIASLKGEAHKSEDIQINRALLQEQLVKSFGPDQGRRLAKQYIRDIEDHAIYINDETSLATSYTYSPFETISVSYKGVNYLCPFESLYSLCSEFEELDNIDDEVYCKYPIDMSIKDKDGTTNITRLVRKRRHRDMVRVKTTFGEDIIVTDNHPMIMSEDKEDTTVAADCAEGNQLRVGSELEFNGQESINMYQSASNPIQEFDSYYLTQTIEGGSFKPFRKHINLNSSVGYFVGFFIGDGNYHMSPDGEGLSSELCFTQKDTQPLKELADIAYREFGLHSVLDVKPSGSHVTDCTRLRINSHELVRFMSQVLGISHGSSNKTLPVNITQFTEGFALGVISGLLDSDGNINNGSGNIRLSSRGAITQLTTLLHHFGYTGGNQHQSLPFGNNTEYTTNYDIWGICFNKRPGCPELPHSFKAKHMIEKDAYIKYTSGWCSIDSVKPITSGNVVDSMDYIYDITTESSTFVCNGLWVHNCAAISLFPMLEKGTKALGGKSGPPKHLQAYVGQLLNTVFMVSSQVAGAVGIPGALIHFDAFARHDYGDNYLETNLEDIKQSLETFLYTINEPAGSRNAQSCFTNISIFDRSYFDALYGAMYYPSIPEIKPNWKSYNKLQEYALDMIREENTKSVLTFPVKTATILHDGISPKDPEFVDMIADDLSKGSLMFMYLSKSVDSLSSCCRLKNSLLEDEDEPNEFSYSLGAGGVSTGSLNVITLNISRIVQEGKNLKSIVDRVHKYQVAHRHIFERFRDSGLYPFYDAGFVDMDKQFLTIGVNGIVEAAESQGIPITPDGEYLEFVNKVLVTISEANKAAKKEYGYKFNTEQVPAESLAKKNARWDKQDGLRVPRDCYNSYMFPVEDPKISIVDKFMLHGSEFIKNFDGGQALHLNLDEHPTKEGYIALINLAIHSGCEYFTTNVLRTCCENPDCGHVEFSKQTKCLKCGSEDISHATRIIGYLKKIKSFSAPRQEEAAIRLYHESDSIKNIESE